MNTLADRQYKKTITFNSFFVFVLYLYSACLILPIVEAYLSAYFTLAIMLIGYLLLFLEKNKRVLNAVLLLFLLLLPFFFLDVFLIRKDSYGNFFYCLYGLLNLVFSIISIRYLVEKKQFKQIRNLAFLIIVLFTITQITTIINIKANPDIARLGVTGLLSNEELRVYSKMNIGGYSLAYLSPIITVAFYFFKSGKRKTILFLAHVVLSFLFLISVQFTTAILLYVFEVASLILSRKRIRRAFIIFVLSLLLFLLLKNTIRDLFATLSETVPSKTISVRLEEVAVFLGGGKATGDAGARLNRYLESLNMFLNHPILGGLIYGEKSGGHSSVLDYIGSFGIVGIVIAVLIIRCLYFSFFVPLKKSTNNSVFHFTFVFYFAFAFLNPALSAVSLFVTFAVSTGVACKQDFRADNHPLFFNRILFFNSCCSEARLAKKK